MPCSSLKQGSESADVQDVDSRQTKNALERKKSIGDVMPEARNGKKDNTLQRAFEEVRNKGTGFISADRIQSSIRAEKLKFRTKKDNIAGLQLCDLIAHPSHIYIRLVMGHNVKLGEFSNKIMDYLIEKKYDRDPKIPSRTVGYGVKHLPR